MRIVSLLTLSLLSIQSIYADVPFTVTVLLKKIPDGQKFYLDYEGIRDSVNASNNQVIFTGTLPKGVDICNAYVLSITDKIVLYKPFLLGEGTTTIIQKSGKELRTAEVKGHVKNDEVNELQRMTSAVVKKQDKIEAKAEKRLAKGMDTAVAFQKYGALLESLEAKQEQISRNYIRQYPEREYSQKLLYGSSKTFGPDSTRSLFTLMPQSFKQSASGQDIQRYLDLHKPLLPGDTYANVVQPDTLGVPLALSSLEGKWVLLEFWASWCGPCREENPMLRQVYEAYHSKGFEIYAVSLDDKKDAWLKAIVADGLKWYHVSDLKGNYNDAALVYGVDAVPSNILINPDGKIVARNIRAKALGEKLGEVFQPYPSPKIKDSIYKKQHTTI